MFGNAMNGIAKHIDRFSETDIDEEIVVMRLDTGEFYSLSGTAASAWRLIDGRRDRAALLTALAAEYETDEGDIATDVDEFLVQLTEFGLIGAA